MKRLAIAVLTVVCLMAASSSSFAAKPKPAKNLCLDWNSFLDAHVLLVKSVGAVKTAPGKVKFFSIVGSAYNGASFPVAGAGHMEGNVFHATYQGNTDNIGADAFELLLNVTNGTGTINYHYDLDDTSVIEGTDGVTVVPCTDLTIAGATAAETEGANGPEGLTSSGK